MKRLFFAVIIMYALYAPIQALGDISVRFVDVGQGDCTIVQTDNKTLIIDLGPPEAQDALEDEINSCGIERIDLLVLTHPHEDHDGNFQWLLDNYDISELWMPEYNDDEEDYGDLLRQAVASGTRIHYPTVGDSVYMGESEITILSAGDTSFYSDKNLWSLVLRIEYYNVAFLVMGDAEDINEYEMIDAGLDVSADVLRVGHHGSNTSTTPAFVDAVKPSYAVVSCGYKNQYGHPTELVLETLERAGVQVLRTDICSTITFSSDGINLDLCW